MSCKYRVISDGPAGLDLCYRSKKAAIRGANRLKKEVSRGETVRIKSSAGRSVWAWRKGSGYLVP